MITQGDCIIFSGERRLTIVRFLLYGGVRKFPFSLGVWGHASQIILRSAIYNIVSIK